MADFTTRDWSTLPDLALAAIIHLLLPSHRDLISFSSVCRSFRSLLSSLSLFLLPSLPPLLFNPNYPLLSPSPNFFSPVRSFNPSPLSPSLLSSHRCLAYSHGHLLLLPHFVSPHLPLKPVIANIITASQISLPSLPSDHLRFPYYYATLTAPPSSPSCLFLLFFSKFSFLSCAPYRPDATWMLHRYSSDVSHVVRVVSFKGRVYGINDRAKLLEFDFRNPNGPNPAIKVSNIRGPPHNARDFDTWHFGPQLITTRDELLLIIFILKPETSIQIYSLDFKKMEWKKVTELPDRAIFIDCGGKSPVSCENPETWGGQSNCVYVAGPGCESWRCFSLDETDLSIPPLRGGVDYCRARWPSPIWVHPSVFF